MDNQRIQRWYVEVLYGDTWKRATGKWIFEAAIAKARDAAINGMTTTRVVKAR